MPQTLRLSVLDQSVARAGRPQDESIRETVALAAHCEALGYERFWVSEHHSHPTIVGSAPEVLMAAIAMRTTRIRIGSAGVMLPHYAAFKVAEQFRVLDALAPGRIDLGVGRAPGSDQRTAMLLNPDPRASEHFPSQVRELHAWVSGAEMPEGHPGRGVQALPMAATAPQLWMLGSSNHGAQLAAHFGMPYAFAHFIAEDTCAEALGLYRHAFQPGLLERPQAVICVWALAADTEEEAWRLFASRERARIDRNVGRLGPLQPPQQAAIHTTEAEEVQRVALRRKAIVGTGPQVAQRLRALADAMQVEEVAVITWTWDPLAQRRSYELLAEALGLQAAQAPSLVAGRAGGR